MAEPSGNPYDFRGPVRHRQLLGGRSDELEQIDSYLRDAALGRPVHLSLFGPYGSGKSSLLNAAVDLAAERGFLAVKLEIRPTTTDSEAKFYGAVLEAALERLVEIGTIERDGSLMQAWRRQTLGDTTVPQAEQPFEMGLVLAAAANGRYVTGVATQVLRRDLERLLGMASLDGLVLCLDSAELIDDNRELAPSLMALAEEMPVLTIVTAGPSAGRLQEVAPRAWAQIEVGPFRSDTQVMDAIARPLGRAGARDIEPGTVDDIHTLTGGRPYEVALVCHFIWEEQCAGEQRDFELSTAVIERVRTELEEKGRHEASAHMAAVARLGAADIEMLERVAPYEALTVRQLALLRLMLNDFDEQQLQDEEQRVLDELHRLQDRGVVRVEQDRFSVSGGDDVRLYIKYAAKRDGGASIRYGDTYERQLTFAISAHARLALLGEQDEEVRILAMGRPHELGGKEAGRWVRGLCDAVPERNVIALADLLSRPVDLDVLTAHREHGAVLLGLTMQIGLHDVEHAALLVNVDGLGEDELQARANDWLEAHHELLGKFEVRGLEVCCRFLPADLATNVAAYAQLQVYSMLATVLYESKLAAQASRLLGELVARAEKLVGHEPSDPLLRAELADAFLRLGFLAASQEAWEEALDWLGKSTRIGLTQSWLVEYDLAYVDARLGRWADALPHAEAAAEARGDHEEGGAFLLAAMPAPGDWTPPDSHWTAVYVQGAWVKSFLSLQTAVIHAQAEPSDIKTLRAAVAEIKHSSPIPLLRLGGWAALTLLNDAHRAVELFDTALANSPFDDIELPRLESDYAHRMAEAQAADAA